DVGGDLAWGAAVADARAADQEQDGLGRAAKVGELVVDLRIVADDVVVDAVVNFGVFQPRAVLDEIVLAQERGNQVLPVGNGGRVGPVVGAFLGKDAAANLHQETLVVAATAGVLGVRASGHGGVVHDGALAHGQGAVAFGCTLRRNVAVDEA